MCYNCVRNFSAVAIIFFTSSVKCVILILDCYIIGGFNLDGKNKRFL